MNLIRPTLLLDKQKCLQNLDTMLANVQKHGLSFRPHFKTHQSAEIATWFRMRGVDKIAVSSLQMASYFAQHAWKDITLAFPVNLLEIRLINQLASQIQLHLVVEDETIAQKLASQLTASVGIFIKIDTGYGRTGILADDFEKLDALVARLQEEEKLQFQGFLAHTGHTYQAVSKEEIAKIHQEALLKMNALKKRYQADNQQITLSLGDTPSCSLMDDFEGIDELRPGNFIFYDVMQVQIGSCSFENIAVALACPVVAKHPSRLQLVLHGGGVHLSKDVLYKNGQKCYGYLVKLEQYGWSAPLLDMPLVSLSQEHGIVQCTAQNFDAFQVGDMLAVLPIHSCMTADLMKRYWTLEGQEIRMMNAANLQE